LVFIVRKGRTVSEQNREGISGGAPRQQGPTKHRTVSRDKGKGKAMTALAWAQK
jgi:hypothetical protein